MKKKHKGKGIKLSAQELQAEVLKLLTANPQKKYSASQIIEKLKIDNNKDAVKYALEQVLNNNMIANDNDSKSSSATPKNFSKNKGSKVIEGKVDMTKSGSAYIISIQSDEDIYVPAKALGGAMHGDRVSVEMQPKVGRKPEGKVLKVLERSSESFIGTIFIHRKYATVVVDKIGFNTDIYVELADTMNAKQGDKVVIKITKWQSKSVRYPIGVVTTVLGMPGSHDIEMKSILINNGFNIVFPDDVLKEAEAISEVITQEEISKRRDFRNITTITIDPVDAKDFDDALSIRHLENGNIEVGVHIADVTHYVKFGTALDKEAYFRSTSVYLADRVCPMLPEKLSNVLCSLRPNEDKLTFSAVFEFDKNYKMKSKWFGKTIIHSDRRFAYEEVQAILDNRKGEFVDELTELNKIAFKLREKRFKEGSINFESEEVRFKFDDKGNPVEVFVKERKEANLLIEDFMLLANKEVAAYIAEKGKAVEIPFVYRIHDAPNMDKLAEFAKFALEMGVKLDIQSPEQISKSLNKLSKEVETNDSLKLLMPLAIRTMSKAIYSTENIGHYGLAFQFYTHFTSPIRRYSDVWVHRILEKNLDKNIYRTDKEKLEEQCKHISLQEREAAIAERESTKYMQVVFAEKMIGQEFDGFISGMIDRGIFVELKNSKCEGLIGFDTFKEPYDVDEGRLKAIGIRTKKVIKMGDPVRVRVVGTDLEKKQIEMVLV